MAADTNININLDPNVGIIGDLRRAFQEKGKVLNIQETVIVVEALVNNNFSGFTFQIGERRNMRPLETSLGDNDAFVMTHMALGIYKENNALTGNFERGGNSQPFYYPDANIFNVAATAVNVSEADALESIYKGLLTAKSDQKEVLLGLPTYKFRIIPDTQVIPGPPAARPSYRGEQFQRMYIPFIFEGKKTNNFTFSVANQADTAQAGGAVNTQNVLQFLMPGFIIRDFCEPVTYSEAYKMLPQYFANNK